MNDCRDADNTTIRIGDIVQVVGSQPPYEPRPLGDIGSVRMTAMGEVAVIFGNGRRYWVGGINLRRVGRGRMSRDQSR